MIYNVLQLFIWLYAICLSFCLFGYFTHFLIELYVFLFFLLRAPRIFWLPVLYQIGEGNGTPLQYSCLENPMDGGAW